MVSGLTAGSRSVELMTQSANVSFV